VRSILYILFAVGGVLVAIALSMVLLDDEGDQQVQPQSPSIELSQPAADKAETPDKDSGTSLQPPNATPAAPLTIDLARVKPDGAAVFAGTAAPNAKIRIFEGDILLGETITNANGEWVIVLEKSLAAGQHLISVAMERSDGTTEMADRSLAVEIYQDTETKPLVALLPETATEVPVLISRLMMWIRPNWPQPPVKQLPVKQPPVKQLLLILPRLMRRCPKQPRRPREKPRPIAKLRRVRLQHWHQVRLSGAMQAVF
jgi:hypothetical protein